MTTMQAGYERSLSHSLKWDCDSEEIRRTSVVQIAASSVIIENGERALTHHDQKVRGMAGEVSRSTARRLISTGIKAESSRIVSCKLNTVNPMGSSHEEVRPQGRTTIQRAKESGESERHSVMERIGQYPHRKVADFRMVFSGKSK